MIQPNYVAIAPPISAHEATNRDIARTREDRAYVLLHGGLDVKQAWLCFGDKRIAAKQKWSRDGHGAWQAFLNPIPAGPVRYWFETETNGKVSRVEASPGKPFEFDFSKLPLPKPPNWAKGAVFYQIFPDRFENGDPKNDGPDVKPWGSKPGRGFMGGDLAGVTKRMDYLKNLGVNALYLCPIFEAGSNHAYDTYDYMKVNERFGTDQDLLSMVGSAHKQNIRVILDCVFNHSGVKFYAFEHLRYKGETSDYRNWYFVDHFPITVAQGQTSYKTFGTSFMMPKFNTDNPETKRYLLNVAGYWIEHAGIDGWRLDVADEVSQDFWREFRTRVHGKKKDALLINETWKDAHPWLQGDQQDSAMNYRFKDAVLDFFKHPEMKSAQLEERLSEVRDDYPDGVLHTMYNMLGSHDTPRVLTEFEGDKKRVALAVALQFTYPGMPAVYYGDEIGMEGSRDPDCRRAMVWDESKWDKTLLALHKDLAALRKSHKALREGEYSYLGDFGHPDLFAFERKLKNERLVILINKGSELKVTHKLGSLRKLLGDAQVSDGAIDLPSMGFAICDAK